VIFGLGAALGWGFADFGAAVVGRKLGSLATLVVAQLTSLLLIGVTLLVVRPEWSGTTGDVLVLLVNAGFVAVAYSTLYHGLALGPVALVSPIASSYAVVTIGLAVVVGGESLNALEIAGAAVTIIGVILTSTDPRTLRRIDRAARAGVPWALISALLFGVCTFVVGRTSQEVGWLETMSLSRAFTFVALLVMVAVRRPSFWVAGAGGLLGAMAVGLADTLGFAMFVRGSELGLISIVTAAASTFTLIPVVGGVVFLGERPAPSQYVGIAFVVAGLVTLATG
jgi:drug/metabolite transporter (DMT)-like permease